MTEPPFRTGDLVRLKTGKSTIQVLEVDYFAVLDIPRKSEVYYHKVRYSKRPSLGWFIRYAYLSSLSHEYEGKKWREAEDFVLIKQEETVMKLYQTKEDEPRFGTFLTKTQNGKIVLEMKGKDGDVQSFEPSDVEEVMPFTAQLMLMHGGDSQNADTRHYEFNKGDVEVGDMMLHISNSNIYKVVAVDTKTRNPTRSKNGFIKLAGEVVGANKK